MSRRKWIDPLDFKDLRKQAGLSRQKAAEELNVTVRTIQNWETGGARIPWMAFRMLRLLRGFALPGVQWQGWSIFRGKLYSPTGRSFDVIDLENIEHVFSQARLWRQMYSSQGRAKTATTVVPFPARPGQLEQPKRKGGKP